MAPYLEGVTGQYPKLIYIPNDVSHNWFTIPSYITSATDESILHVTLISRNDLVLGWDKSATMHQFNAHRKNGPSRITVMNINDPHNMKIQCDTWALNGTSITFPDWFEKSKDNFPEDIAIELKMSAGIIELPNHLMKEYGWYDHANELNQAVYSELNRKLELKFKI